MSIGNTEYRVLFITGTGGVYWHVSSETPLTIEDAAKMQDSAGYPTAKHGFESFICTHHGDKYLTRWQCLMP